MKQVGWGDVLVVFTATDWRPRARCASAGLLAMLIVVGVGSTRAAAEGSKNIRDNSFLIEEAYNQEPGVIQHIQTFQYMNDKSWNYTFTEEWPVPNETHQLSVTVPVNHLDSDDGSATGPGDLMLNYRYQLILKDPVALAPRASLILPTGNEKKELGDDAWGLQANIPLSVEWGEDWVTHLNLGTTHLFAAKGSSGARRDKTSFTYGASLIYLFSQNVNFLMEAAGSSLEHIQGDGLVKREDHLFLNPGVRFAMNFDSGLQVVPGIGVPIGIGASDSPVGVFAYLSLEHPAF